MVNNTKRTLRGRVKGQAARNGKKGMEHAAPRSCSRRECHIRITQLEEAAARPEAKQRSPRGKDFEMRNISAWAIRNPIPVIVLFIALTLAGMIGFTGMDINAMPDISFPAAQITVSQPGAAPTEME